jgi:preprotein translocase subunit SecG
MGNWFCQAMSGCIQAGQTICMLMVTQNGKKIRVTGNNLLGGQLTLYLDGSGNFGLTKQQKVHVHPTFSDQSSSEGGEGKLKRSTMILLACLFILAAIVWAWQWKRGKANKETSYPLPTTGKVGVATPQKQFMLGEPVQK